MKKILIFGCCFFMMLLTSCKGNSNAVKGTEGTANSAATQQTEVLAAEVGTEVGNIFTDFEQNDPTGKPVKASDIVKKNKFTLIDFWASWCGPCIAEMSAVKKTYEDFHAKGFEILGVSLDKDADSWKAAIAQLRLSWHHVSDLNFWENAAAKQYNVNSIPSNVLVDKNGMIVAKDLRGEILYNKIAELLK